MKTKVLLLALSLISLASCLEPEQLGEPQGQIVVIGNGALWEETLVVDVKSNNIVESLVADGGLSLKPVLETLKEPEVVPATLDWIVQTNSKDVLVQVTRSQLEACETEPCMSRSNLYEKSPGLKVPERKPALEKLTFSKNFEPMQLSDGALIFVNAQDELRYSMNGEKSILVAQNIERFLWSREGALFFKTKSQSPWKVLSYQYLKTSDQDLEPSKSAEVQEFSTELIFATQSSRLFAISSKKTTFESQSLRAQKLYEYRGRELGFVEVWPESIFMTAGRFLTNRPLIQGERAWILLGAEGSAAQAEVRVVGLDFSGNVILPVSQKVSATSVLKVSANQILVYGSKTEVCEQLIGSYACREILLGTGVEDLAFVAKSQLAVGRRSLLGDSKYQILSVDTNFVSPHFGEKIEMTPVDSEILAVRFFGNH